MEELKVMIPSRHFLQLDELHDDKMDGYRAPCLDNAYHLMAT